jgi:hypothetical protein
VFSAGLAAPGQLAQPDQYKNALYGNAGNDTLDGGTAADALFGGPGDDTLLADEMPVDQFWPGNWVEYFADFYSGGGANDTIVRAHALVRRPVRQPRRCRERRPQGVLGRLQHPSRRGR